MQIRYPEWKNSDPGWKKFGTVFLSVKGHSSLTKHDGKSNRKKTVNETSINAVKKRKRQRKAKRR
jgi:hypothetical protein